MNEAVQQRFAPLMRATQIKENKKTYKSVDNEKASPYSCRPVIRSERQQTGHSNKLLKSVDNRKASPYSSRPSDTELATANRSQKEKIKRVLTMERQVLIIVRS